MRAKRRNGLICSPFAAGRRRRSSVAVVAVIGGEGWPNERTCCRHHSSTNGYSTRGESFALPETLPTRLYWLIAGRARGRTNENGMRATLERVRRSSNLTAIPVGRHSAPGSIIASQRHMPISWT
jgi:hypothetical protein